MTIPAWWKRANLWPLAEALDAMKAGLDREEWGNLNLAMDAFRHRLEIDAPRLLGQALYLAAKRLAARRPIVGMAYVAFEQDGYWRPIWNGNAGALAYVIPEILWSPLVRPPVAECIDIIAVDDAGDIWSLTGEIECLGSFYIHEAMREGNPVRLVASPVEWARVGGNAANVGCVLPFDSAVVETLLLHSKQIIAVDKDHTARLQHAETLQKIQRILRPKLPRIALLAED